MNDLDIRRKLKEELSESRIADLMDVSHELDFYVTVIAKHHARITKKDCPTIDIYITNNKFHNLSNNKHGIFSDVKKFLRKIY